MLLGLWLMPRVCSFECARILHETLLVSVLMYGSETMIFMEEERSRIRVVQIDKIRSLLGIRRMDRIVRKGERGG